MNKAFFIDRDGVILQHVYNIDAAIITTALHPDQIDYNKGVFEFLRRTKNAGYLNIVISNQPNIGLKRQSKTEFIKMTNILHEKFKKELVTIDAEYYCFHHPFAHLKKYKKDCDCRKPKIGLFKQAAKKHDITLHQSFFIGDSVTDVIAGHEAGCKTIFLGNNLESGYLKILQDKLGDIKPDFYYKNFNEILKNFPSILKKQA